MINSVINSQSMTFWPNVYLGFRPHKPVKRRFYNKMDSYFYRTSLRRIYNCTEPDIPEGTPFSWAFYAAELAIIEIPAYANLPAHPGLERIEGKLGALLGSSHKYPPARALAAEALEESELEWPALADRMEQLLTHYFESQATSGSRLLKCLEDQGDSLEMCGYGGVGHLGAVLFCRKT